MPLRQAYIISLSTLAALVALALGCHNRPAEIATLEARITALEARNAQLAKAEQRLTALEPVVRGLEATAAGAQAQVRALAVELEAALARLSGVERTVEDNRNQPRRPRVPGPDPSTVYAVPVAGSPFRGPKTAKVTMVRIFEFACPYCERSRVTMDQLRGLYGRDLRIVYKHLLVHPHIATLPAQAACAADEQKRFFEMEDALWEKAYKQNRDFSQTNIETIARGLGLDMKRFLRDLHSPMCVKRVADDQALAGQVGARGTPAFFINGRFLSGARPINQFQQLIDEELAKANRAIKAGTVKQRDYYDYVVKNGKKTL